MEENRNLILDGEEDQLEGAVGGARPRQQAGRRPGLLHAEEQGLQKVLNAAESLMRMQGGDISDPAEDRFHEGDDRRTGRGNENEYGMMRGDGGHIITGRNAPNQGHYRPRVMPDQYDGKRQWEEYLSYFENCAVINEWDDHHKAQYLRVSLRGAANQFLRTLPEHKKQDYNQLVTLLGRRFNPDNQRELFRAELKNVTREDKQTLPELGEEVRRLARMAYPNAPEDMLDGIGKDHFIDALDDADLRWRVYQVKAKSLDDAITAAVEMEAYKKAEKQRGPSKKYVREIETSEWKTKNTGTTDKEIEIQGMQKQLDQLVKMITEFKGSGDQPGQSFNNHRNQSFDNQRNQPFNNQRNQSQDNQRNPPLNNQRNQPQDNQRNPPLNNQRNQSYDNRRNPPFNNQRNQQYNNQRNPVYNNQRRGVECWNCNESGHYRTECPELGMQQGQYQNRNTNSSNY